MVKNILKELVITVLLCIVIVFILSIVFYDYNPLNKVVPGQIDKYSTSNSIKEEINVNVLSLESTSVVYKVEDTDLNMYIKNKNYVQGKANPFEASSPSSGKSELVDGSTDGSGSSSTGSTSDSGKISTSSDGTFYNGSSTK